MEINKETAVSYIRSDISILSEQSEANEILAGVHRIRGQIGLLMSIKVLSVEEAASLEDEMGKAREIAAARVAK